MHENISVKYVPSTGGKHWEQLIWNFTAASKSNKKVKHHKDIFDACAFLQSKSLASCKYQHVVTSEKGLVHNINNLDLMIYAADCYFFQKNMKTCVFKL